MSRVFANGMGDRGLIPGRVILKTQKMVLDTSLLSTQYCKVLSRVKWSNPGKEVAPTVTHRCCSYWQGGFRVTLNNGRQLFLYIYIYIYVVHSIRFQTFLYRYLKFQYVIAIHLMKFQYVIAIYLMRWQTNSYDFRFKSTATTAIGIHPTKAWLSRLVKFKNAIWHFRRTICNNILF